MNKEMRQRAARWAKRHIDKPTTPTVRNWTHEDAANHLAQAYLAGARSMDRWHRNKPVYVGDIVDVKVGPLSAASTLVSNGALLAPLSLRDPTARHCRGCGLPQQFYGDKGWLCPNALCAA